MRRASAVTVPSTCTRHSHVPEVNPNHTATAAEETSTPAGLQTQHDSTESKQNTVLPIRLVLTHATHLEYNFLTEVSEKTILSPLVPRKQRAQTGGGDYGTIFGTFQWQGVDDFGPLSAAGSLF